MKESEMKNDDQYELAGLQRRWKADDERPSLPNLESRVRREIASRRRSRRPRLLLVASLWVIGLLLMATYHQYLRGNLGFLALAVILLILAAWLGTCSLGPDPLSAKPQDYVRLRTSNKARGLRRTRIAQLIAAFLLVILLWATWFTSKARLHIGSWQDEFLPLVVLLMTLAMSGGLAIVRGSRRKELNYLRQLEKQFESLDEQLANPDPNFADKDRDKPAAPPR
jgi:hypothetical protein